jgi:hypothetical protein
MQSPFKKIEHALLQNDVKGHDNKKAINVLMAFFLRKNNNSRKQGKRLRESCS